VYPCSPAGVCPHDSAMDLAQRVCHLYECEKLSTYQIAVVVGIGRQRVGRTLRRAGVAAKPRGAGRRRPEDPRAGLAESLYLRGSLSTTQISGLTGVPVRTVQGWLRTRGVPMRSRGPRTREDRHEVPADALAELYVRQGLSAAQAGHALGVPARVVLRTAHDSGLPVRVGGPPPQRGPAEIQLIDALYADPLVRRVLARHGIGAVAAGGPIWQRFPAALLLNADLAGELYLDCGLAVKHIKLLSGQPAQTVLSLLHKIGVPVRVAGGPSPFLRRWRGSRQAGSPGPPPRLDGKRWRAATGRYADLW
jgi:predicted HTH domain antitoxin